MVHGPTAFPGGRTLVDLLLVSRGSGPSVSKRATSFFELTASPLN